MSPFPLLTDADRPRLQQLLEACSDYHLLVNGQEATPDEAKNLLAELPPGRSRDDKRVLDLGDGVLDVVRGYREPGEWYLGLLLFMPGARGKGRGKQVLAELIAWLKAEGATRLRLAVAEQNEAALRFWQREGFMIEKRFPARPMGVRETVLLELVRDL